MQPRFQHLLRFTPDDRLIAVSDKARVWDVATGKITNEFATSGWESACLSRDCELMAEADGRAEVAIRIRDVSTGRVRTLFHENRRTVATSRTLKFSPDAKLLASAVNNDTLRVSDVATGKTLLQRGCPDSEMTCAAFSPDGRQIATGMNDGTVLLWDVAVSFAD